MMMKMESISQLGLAFFGLTLDNVQEVRMNLFKSLHSIIFHSKGAYDYYTIYNMPIWLRKFTFKEIQDLLNEVLDSVRLEKKRIFKNKGSF